MTATRHRADFAGISDILAIVIYMSVAVLLPANDRR